MFRLRSNHITVVGMKTSIGLPQNLMVGGRLSVKGARTVVVRIINMLPDKLVMAGIIVLIL